MEKINLFNMPTDLMSADSVSMILDEDAWNMYMNFCFQVWYDRVTDTYALSNSYINPVFYAIALTVEQLNNLLKSFNPFWKESKIDKQTYTGIVEFTLESMFELAEKDPSYCILLDLVHYSKSTIMTENKLTADEFISLVERVARNHNRKGGVK